MPKLRLSPFCALLALALAGPSAIADTPSATEAILDGPVIFATIFSLNFSLCFTASQAFSPRSVHINSGGNFPDTGGSGAGKKSDSGDWKVERLNVGC